MKKVITAKWKSNCSETRKPIQKGETMLYNYDTKQCYSMSSDTAKKFMSDNAPDQAGGMLEAQIEQAAENWYHSTYQNEV